MKKIKTYIQAAALLLMTGACTYPFDADIKDSGDVLIVEGNITVGTISHILIDRITHVSGTQSTAPLSFNVRVEGEDGTFVEGTGDNPYELDTRDLPAGQKYRLKITSTTDGSIYLTDYTTVLGAPEVDDLKYEIYGNIMSVKISLHSDTTPYFQISYDERWEYEAWTDTHYVYNKETDEISFGSYPYYTCWDHSDYAKSTTMSAEAYIGNRLVDYAVVNLSNTDRKLSSVYNIMMKVSLIPPESYRYWQNLEKISKPDGDLFSPIPSSMRGNIYKEGDPNVLVLGYVGFAAAKETSLYFNNAKENFYIKPFNWINNLLSDKKISSLDTNEWKRYYNSGYWPYDVIVSDIGNIIGYVWVNQECVDCRKQGGSTSRPSDWMKEIE